MNKIAAMHCTLASLALGVACTLMAAQANGQYRDPVHLDKPGSCTIPASERRQEAGCYVVAVELLKGLSKGPLFWHLYTYPTRQAAEKAKGNSAGTVVSSLGRVWLFKIAPAGWQPESGKKVAMVGPLPGFQANEYEARYLESIKLPNPGSHTPVHRHPGVEAWYIVSGSQCMQIPGRTFVVSTGETAVVPAGVPMMVTLTHTNRPERALALVFQDATKPWMTFAKDWAPTSACPQ